MHIQNFEDEVHALILERGLQYFESGAVHALTETPDGWSADVQGSDEDNYRVILHGTAHIDDWHCDCPYDHGPICKHVVAVLYAVKSTSEKQDIAENILDNIEGAALKRFLKERMLDSEEFQENLLDYFDEEE